MKNLVKSGLVLLAGILVLSTSCDQTNNSGEAGKGTVVIKMTDAPFPVSLVDEAWVTIDKIEIRSTSTVSGTTTTETTEDDGLESMYTVLYEGEGMDFNLLDLQNGVTTDVLTMDIEPGTYDLIRMYVVDAEVILKNGETFDLKIPSGSSSGLKIKLTPELAIESGVESNIVLDFDVSKSFVVQGNPKTPAGIKGFLFKPVIRGMVEKHSGIIEGIVAENATTPVAEAHVQIFKGDVEIGSALTGANGKYAIIGLPAGNYKVVCGKEGYTAVQVDQVIVKAKQKTVQDFLLVKL